MSTACAEEHVWVRYARWWHLVFAVIAVVTVAAIVTDSSLSADRRAIAIALIFLLALVYAFTGGRAMHRATATWPYLSIMPVLFVGMVACAPQAAILLFALCPQVFALTERFSRAMALVAVLTVSVATVDVLNAGISTAAFVTAGGGTAISLAFSALIGFYIDRIIRQSRQRADLIEQLRSAQAELAVAHHAAGVAAERERLAAEIHDTLAQGFTSLLMLVQAAEAELDDDREQARRHLQLAARTARENLDEARSLVGALAPALQGATLREAMSRMVERFAEETGVDTTLEVNGTPRSLPSATEVVLLRTVQEALNNVRRHAAAGSATVRLSYADGGATVQVSDDGCGFEPGRISGGFGLKGMRSRVEQAGGEVSVDSAPGTGTTVRVRLA